MQRGIIIAVIAVAALGAGVALIWNGSTADAGTKTGAAAVGCGQECVSDCSGCPGAAKAAPEAGAPAGDAKEACAAACDHDCAGCASKDGHHADAGCACGGDRAACTEAMKAACEHHEKCDCSHKGQ